MLVKKLAFSAALLCLVSSSFAAEIKLINAAPEKDTVMSVSYKICSADNTDCSREITLPIFNGSLMGISDANDKHLVITNVKATKDSVNGPLIAESTTNGNVCSGVFGVDSVLLFNNYHTKHVICSYGFSA